MYSDNPMTIDINDLKEIIFIVHRNNITKENNQQGETKRKKHQQKLHL